MKRTIGSTWRIGLAAALMLGLALPASGQLMDEIGVKLDLSPLPPVGSEPFEWMSTISFFGEIPLGTANRLHVSIGTPFNRWILQLSFELTHRLDRLFATDALLTTAGIPEGAHGAQLDLGIRTTPIDTQRAHFSFATFPVGVQVVDHGGGWEWGLLLGLNLTADARLILANTITLGVGTRATLLQSHPVGEPIFPLNEDFGTFTHFSAELGYRP